MEWPCLSCLALSSGGQVWVCLYSATVVYVHLEILGSSELRGLQFSGAESIYSCGYCSLYAHTSP